MPSTYFIVDFAYNPDSDKPLAIFELGDAFYSEYPNKKMGAEQLTPYQYLGLDIKKQHKDPVFVKVTPSGLDLTSLTDNQSLQSFDKNNPSFSIREFCNSYGKINDLLLSIFSNSGLNNDGRDLILHIAHLDLYHDYDWVEQNNGQVKLLNHTSKTLKDAFYNKATLADSANGSPIFPGTLIIPGWRKINESDIDRFLAEHNAEYYVIKPAIGTHAEGVHVVKANQLKQTLKQTLKDTPNYALQEFIVQVCHLSKQLEYNDESYYAKSRAIIRVDFLPYSDEPKISVVTAFWQLANSPARDLLDDKNVIANMDANQEGVLEISAEDLHHITHEFTMHLPGIIKKMQFNDIPVINKRASVAPDQTRLSKDLLSFLDTQSITHSYNAGIFNNDLMKMKHFVIDILGLNKEFHDWVNYSDESIEEYVNNATAIFCGNKNNTLNRISIASMLKQQTPTILGAALIVTMTILVTDDPDSNKSFNLKLLAGAVAVIISSLVVGLVTHPAVARVAQSFFKPVEKKDAWALSENRPNYGAI